MRFFQFLVSFEVADLLAWPTRLLSTLYNLHSTVIGPFRIAPVTN